MLGKLFSHRVQLLIMLVHQLLQIVKLTLSVLSHKHTKATMWSQHVME